MLGLMASSFGIKYRKLGFWPNVTKKRNFFKKLLGWVQSQTETCTPYVSPNLNACSKIETRGMSMPIIGIGTWQVKRECVDSVISYALDVGYRHIDTAHSYGNQDAIGETLDKLFKCGKYCRNEIFITCKLPYYGMCAELVPYYVRDALNCLRVDYIDLFLIHFPVGIREVNGDYIADPETSHIHIWKALEQEVECGTIKSLGLSNFNMHQIINIKECATIPPANLQVEMHLYLQQKELSDYCMKECIGMTAYAPLGSPGLDQYLMKNGLPATSVPEPLSDRSINSIACKYKKTPSQVLLRFLLQKGVAVIPKSSLPDRIYKNFDLFNFQLDHCEMEELCAKDLCENGRMFANNVWAGTECHPQYPFPRK